MALIVCPECKKLMSDSAVSCPHCGYKPSPEKIAEIKKKNEQLNKELKSGCGLGCLIVIIIIIIVGLVNFFYPSSSPNNSASQETVVNSSWDGSVDQVKSWLKGNLKDPDSLQFIEWSSVSKTNDGGFMVRVKYRAKNSFGGYVVENKVFFLNSSGTVINNADYIK